MPGLVPGIPTRDARCLPKRDGRDIGERSDAVLRTAMGRAKRRRSSNGYGPSEATPFFERLWAERSDAVLRTAMGRAKRRRSSNGYGPREATPFPERPFAAMTE